jgi:hypothetical protein
MVVRNLVIKLKSNGGFATLTKGYTFGATETVTAAKLSSLVGPVGIS